MYISRIELNAARRETLRALASPSILHGALESCFEGVRAHPLWRIDALNGKSYLLTVSAAMPDLSQISKQFGFLDSPGETRDYSAALARICTGDVVRFRLRANPTHRVTQDGVKKLLAHQTPEHQRGWLIKKSQLHGFSLRDSEFDAVADDWKRFRKPGSKLIEIRTVTFDGVLTVTDADTFRTALTGGIGRAKAYGCGLMTAARLDTK